jgi:hypothetical protein
MAMLTLFILDYSRNNFQLNLKGIMADQEERQNNQAALRGFFNPTLLSVELIIEEDTRITISYADIFFYIIQKGFHPFRAFFGS